VLLKSHRLPLDANLYFNVNDLLVDQVHQFSNFTTSLNTICTDLKIPFSGEIPREKYGIKSDRKPYQDYYDEETKAKVTEMFAREIRTFKYSFD
jgi:hypothetical protein